MNPRVIAAVVLLLISSGCAEGKRLVDKPKEHIWFIHPKSHVRMAGMSGADIPVQVWVLEHEDNRKLVFQWQGIGCAGSGEHQLDGKYESRVQPPMAPRYVRMLPGLCTIVASVLDSSGRVRHRAIYEMHICGGTLEECTDESPK